MARIRSIKPEFWTDEKVLLCSIPARLLFIGTWNQADDYGNLDASPIQLKTRILPGDAVEVGPLVAELVTAGLLDEYSTNDKKYLHIKNFPRHQKIDRPSGPRCPLPDGSPTTPRGTREGSARTPRVFDEPPPPEGKGREGKGMEDPPLPPLEVSRARRGLDEREPPSDPPAPVGFAAPELPRSPGFVVVGPSQIRPLPDTRKNYRGLGVSATTEHLPDYRDAPPDLQALAKRLGDRQKPLTDEECRRLAAWSAGHARGA